MKIEQISFRTAWVIMLIFYGIDCLIITPYILYNNLGIEGGFLMSKGYEQMGLIWFPGFFLLFALFLYFVLELAFNVFDWTLKENSKYPKLAIIILWIILMIGGIINNLRFIL